MSARPQALIELLGDVARPVLHRLPSGWVDPHGYPVDENGRPDWCARCASLETIAATRDPHWRPARRERRQSRNPDGSASELTLALCAACARYEQAQRAKTPGAAPGRTVRVSAGGRAGHWYEVDDYDLGRRA